ncbi:hypothetical protein [Gallaecimonas xiamenensis]|uniref:hypothetical protein n=1 Tax=Gallaecimonas xiamenensis TaxID=1207039 RepID=UPI0012EA3415|nr:hypothetical protein [Gallaecimonas xiamenensis]
MNTIRTLLLLVTAISPALHAETCSVSEKDILGAWGKDGEQGYFDEFSLDTDSDTHVFNSWIDHRPEISGAGWEIKDCQLLISGRYNEFPPFQLKIIGLKEERLRLYDEEDSLEWVYKRISKRP